MTLIKKPFVKYDKKKYDIFSVRLNDSERLMLDYSKVYLDIDKDSTALKVLSTIGFNVIKTTFSPEILKYLSSSQRNRLSDTSLYDDVLKSIVSKKTGNL